MDQRTGVVFGVISAVIVLIIMVIGIKVYYSTATVGELDVQTERFTGLSNASDVSRTLAYPPLSTAEFSGTWYNSSSAAWSTLAAGLFTRTGASLTLLTNTGGNDGLNMSSVNVTYYTQAGVTMRDAVNVQAGSVFTLAPVIGLVLLAALIVGVIVTLAGRKPQ